MKQRFTKFGMVVAFMLSFLSAAAYDFKVDGIYYSVTDSTKLECEVVSGGSKYEGNVNIPSSVSFDSRTFTVVGMGHKVFQNCYSLKSVNIPESVRAIGEYAFANCRSLTSVNIPESVLYVGEYAFSSCSSLTSVIMPSSVTFIGKGVFRYCSSLTDITIPNTVTEISGYAFYYCSSLVNVVIPSSVTSIGEYAFYHCSSLVNVVIPSSVTYIGEGAFEYCSAMTSVTISDSLKTIRKNTFLRCNSLTDITIPNSVRKIEESAFYECSSVSNISIGNSVESIGEYAFYGCSLISKLKIPDSVKIIGVGGFTGDSLEIVETGDGLESLSGIPTAKEMKLGKSIKEIPAFRFQRSKKLERIYMAGVEKIGSQAFYQCFALNEIVLPEGLKEIGGYAFYQCDSLQTIEIPNSVEEMGHEAFSLCGRLSNVQLGKNIKMIDLAFRGCKAISDLTVPSGVENIVSFEESRNPTSGLISYIGESFSPNLKKLRIEHSEQPLIWYYRDYKGNLKLCNHGLSYLYNPRLPESIEEIYVNRNLSGPLYLEKLKVLYVGDKLNQVEIKSKVGLDTIISYAIEPPTLPAYSTNEYMNTVVKVPQESLEKYQQAENWKNFWNLQGFDPNEAGVGEVTVSPAEIIETGRYDLNGRKVTPDYEGIVIVRYSDGTARKLISKK